MLTNKIALRAFALLTSLTAVAYSITYTSAYLDDNAGSNTLAMILYNARSGILIGFSLWLAYGLRPRQPDIVEQRQARLLTRILLLLIALYAVIGLIDETGSPPVMKTLYYVSGILLAVHGLLFVRAGHTAAAGLALLIGFLIETIGSLGIANPHRQYVIPLMDVLSILIAGLLVRWWIGLALAVLLPPLTIILQTTGLAATAPNISITMSLLAFLSLIGALVALYARELQLALLRADAQARELASVNASIEQRIERRTEELARSKAQVEGFLHRMVHDLSAPVQGLQSVAQHPRWHSDQSELQRMARGQVSHLASFVEQAQSYLFARRLPLRAERVALLPVTLAAVDSATPLAERSGVTITQDIELAEPAAQGDAAAIRRILDNLLRNAIQASPAGASVTVRLSERAGQLVLQVADTGAGIPREEHQRIFEPYASGGHGLGLGLAIVKELAEGMGGSCEVQSKLGQGSTLSVTLPLPPEEPV